MSQGFTTLTASDSLSEIVEAQIDNNSTLLSCNAGGTAPTGDALVDGAPWYDTSLTPHLLKQYDLGNATWRIVGNMGQAGSSTAYGYNGILINHDTTLDANTTTSEEDMHSYSIPANVLSAAGDYLEFETYIVAAATGTAKNIRAYLGSTNFWESGSQIVSGILIIKGRILAGAPTSQTCYAVGNSSDSLWGTHTEGASASETASGAITFKFTAECGAASDIVQYGTAIKYFRKP